MPKGETFNDTCENTIVFLQICLAQQCRYGMRLNQNLLLEWIFLLHVCMYDLKLKETQSVKDLVPGVPATLTSDTFFCTNIMIYLTVNRFELKPKLLPRTHFFTLKKFINDIFGRYITHFRWGERNETKVGKYEINFLAR